MKKWDFDYTYEYQSFGRHGLDDASKQKEIDWSLYFIKLHNIAPKHKNDKILEIGCGNGRFMVALQSLGYENIEGVDISKTQIALAKKEKLNVTLADAVNYLKKTNKIYDAIYLFDVIEHIEKDKMLEFLKLLNRHLSTTGFVVIKTPNAMSPIAAFNRYIDFTHTVLFTENVMYFLIKNAGFDSVATRPDWPESWKLRRLKSSYAKMIKIYFGIKKPITSANIVSVVFKDKNTYNNYLKSAPKIKK